MTFKPYLIRFNSINFVKFKMVERSTNRAINNIDLIEQMKIEVSH